MDDATQQTVATVVRTLAGALNRNLTMGVLCDAYMAAYTGRDKSRPGTVAAWLTMLGSDRIVAEIDADAIQTELDSYAAGGGRRFLGRDSVTGEARTKLIGPRSAATVNRMKAVLSALLMWAHRRRLLPRGWQNPCREVYGQREGRGRTRFLTSEERKRLLAIARISKWPKLYLAILMALTTGARRGELLSLRHRDVDLAAGVAHLRATKNGEERVLPLTPYVIAEIQRHGKPTSPDDLLFGRRSNPSKPFQFEALWQRALRDARIEDFRFHDLRHSCASALAQSGASLLEIADVLGHKSLDVTRRYSHLTVGHKAALVNRVLGKVA